MGVVSPSEGNPLPRSGFVQQALALLEKCW
jgi:hypothetical protein